MQLYVRLKVLDTLPGDADIKVRAVVGEQIGKIMQSGKVVFSGIFGDQRGGFFVLNVNEAYELYELLDFAVLVNCEVETHPLLSIDQLMKFFQTHG